MGRAASETLLTYRLSLRGTAARRRRGIAAHPLPASERQQGRRGRCFLSREGNGVTWACFPSQTMVKVSAQRP
jgi:hypothetical protein